MISVLTSFPGTDPSAAPAAAVGSANSKPEDGDLQLVKKIAESSNVNTTVQRANDLQ